MYKYFKKIRSADNISGRRSKGLSDEVTKPPCNTLAPTLRYTGIRMYVKFNGSFLKQDIIRFNRGKTANIYIVYNLGSTLNYNENFFFGAVRITKNADVSKYKYFGYDIGFHA